MAMAVTQEWRHTQNFMLAMNVKQEEVSESEYFPKEKEEHDHEEEGSLTVSHMYQYNVACFCDFQHGPYIFGGFTLYSAACHDSKTNNLVDICLQLFWS
ncbi:hypothetical protein PS2_034445 [Malus domestica]